MIIKQIYLHNFKHLYMMSKADFFLLFLYKYLNRMTEEEYVNYFLGGQVLLKPIQVSIEY